MSISIGLILGFIGIIIVIVPLIIQLVVRSQNTDANIRRNLETASILIGIALVLYIGGFFLTYYLSGESVAKYVGFGAKFAEENPELFA